MTEKLHRKCLAYQKNELRVPPESLVVRWGRELGLSRSSALDVSSKLDLRHGEFEIDKNCLPQLLTLSSLGREPGMMGNTPIWKETTPSIFRSPFLVHADLGKNSSQKPSISPIANNNTVGQDFSVWLIKSMGVFSSGCRPILVMSLRSR